MSDEISMKRDMREATTNQNNQLAWRKIILTEGFHCALEHRSLEGGRK